MERKVDGGAVSEPVPMSDYDKQIEETVRVVDSRADVDSLIDTPVHTRFTNLVFSHSSNFEQQLLDIDDAINDNVSAMTSVTNQEARVGWENNVQDVDKATLERKESTHANGPHATAHAQSLKDGLQGTFFKPMQEPNKEMGLTQSGIAFSLGPSTTKQQKAQGVKKTKGSNERKNKENRDIPSKDKKLDGEETHHQRDTNAIVSTMEYEMMDMGIKRRARTPLAELENKEDNGKRVKVDEDRTTARTGGSEYKTGRRLGSFVEETIAGSDYTWSRRLGSRGWVRERLDRALVSTTWAVAFPLVKFYHLSNSVSDHSILVLKETSLPRKQQRKSRLFHFESMWLEDERRKNVVEEAWERGRTSHSQWPFEACLEECQMSLRSWNTHTFGHVGKQVADLQRKFQMLENMKATSTDLEAIHATKMELNRWLGIEEKMWQQRSRNNWLKAGDKNTTFFHTKASNQYQRNTISRIMDANNKWLEDVDQIGQAFVGYFEELFSTSRPKVEQEMIDAIHSKVTERMNSTLTQGFHAMEVEKALKQMHPL
uniref:Uncharacterized protein n=1 Tax=Quercus lobata TaxID=97700 RepID=A0A7N2KPR4_QUELO